MAIASHGGLHLPLQLRSLLVIQETELLEDSQEESQIPKGAYVINVLSLSCRDLDAPPTSEV
jgi:hypothetical protein